MIQFNVGDVAWDASAALLQVVNTKGDEKITVTFKYLQMDNDYTWEYIYNSAEGVPPYWAVIRNGKVIQ